MVTIAQAAGDLAAVSNANSNSRAKTLKVPALGLEDESAVSGETFPVMPHLDLSEEELAGHHPSILAPPEEPLQDILRDEDDAVYAHGCRIAASIQGEVDRHGRRRHCATPTATGHAVQRPRLIGATAAARHTAIHATGHATARHMAATGHASATQSSGSSKNV